MLDVVRPRLWDIDPVQLLGRRLGAEYRPIALRVAVLVVLGVLATVHAQLIVINRSPRAVSDPLDPTVTGSMVTGPLLLLVGTLSTIPAAVGRAEVVLPLGESLAASLVVGAIGPIRRRSTSPTSLIPLTTAGSLPASAQPSPARSSRPWSSRAPSLAGTHRPDLSLWFWLPLLAAAAGVSGWARRVLDSQRPTATYDAAYANAHRLLSELNIVARQLSLGLDPHTLATGLG